MLGFGLGLSHCGIKGGVADAPDFTDSNGAQALLTGESQGLAFDFTDSSAYIIDTGTPANNYDSTGIVSSGALVGPSGKLTYTSPSNKMTRQADGYYKYQAHNLYLNSASPTDQAITVVSGASYAVTITGTVSVTASGAATGTWTAGTNTFTAATTTLTLGSTSGSGTVHVRRTPSNDDYIATAGSPLYALPLEYDTSGNCLGLLVEEARTNGLANNSTPSTYLSADFSVVTDNYALSPQDIQNAARLYTTTNAGVLHRVYALSVLSAVTSYTLSVYVKAVSTSGYYIGIREDGATGAGAVFDPANNFAVVGTYATGAVSAVAASVESVGGGWYRIIASFTSTSMTPGFGLSFVPDTWTSGAFLSAWEPASEYEFIFWGMQAEPGAFPTSRIITYGAAATRLADQLSQLTSTFPLSATAGSFYAYVTPYAGADLAGIVSLNDGSGDEEIVIYKDASANIVAQVEDGGVGQLAPLDSTVNASSGTAFNVALAWAANDFALSANGTAAQTDTGGTLPTVTTLELGVDQANNYFNGIIKAISYVPRRKSDAELQAETA